MKLSRVGMQSPQYPWIPSMQENIRPQIHNLSRASEESAVWVQFWFIRVKQSQHTNTKCSAQTVSNIHWIWWTWAGRELPCVGSAVSLQEGLRVTVSAAERQTARNEFVDIRNTSAPRSCCPVESQHATTISYRFAQFPLFWDLRLGGKSCGWERTFVCSPLGTFGSQARDLSLHLSIFLEMCSLHHSSLLSHDSPSLQSLAQHELHRFSRKHWQYLPFSSWAHVRLGIVFYCSATRQSFLLPALWTTCAFHRVVFSVLLKTQVGSVLPSWCRSLWHPIYATDQLCWKKYNVSARAQRKTERHTKPFSSERTTFLAHTALRNQSVYWCLLVQFGLTKEISHSSAVSLRSAQRDTRNEAGLCFCRRLVIAAQVSVWPASCGLLRVSGRLWWRQSWVRNRGMILCALYRKHPYIASGFLAIVWRCLPFQIHSHRTTLMNVISKEKIGNVSCTFDCGLDLKEKERWTWTDTAHLSRPFRTPRLKTSLSNRWSGVISPQHRV